MKWKRKQAGNRRWTKRKTEIHGKSLEKKGFCSMQDSIKCRQLQQLLAQAHRKIELQNREISALRHMMMEEKRPIIKVVTSCLVPPQTKESKLLFFKKKTVSGKRGFGSAECRQGERSSKRTIYYTRAIVSFPSSFS